MSSSAHSRELRRARLSRENETAYASSSCPASSCDFLSPWQLTSDEDTASLEEEDRVPRDNIIVVPTRRPQEMEQQPTWRSSGILKPSRYNMSASSITTPSDLLMPWQRSNSLREEDDNKRVQRGNGIVIPTKGALDTSQRSYWRKNKPKPMPQRDETMSVFAKMPLIMVSARSRVVQFLERTLENVGVLDSDGRIDDEEYNELKSRSVWTEAVFPHEIDSLDYLEVRDNKLVSRPIWTEAVSSGEESSTSSESETDEELQEDPVEVPIVDAAPRKNNRKLGNAVKATGRSVLSKISNLFHRMNSKRDKSTPSVSNKSSLVQVPVKPALIETKRQMPATTNESAQPQQPQEQDETEESKSLAAQLQTPDFGTMVQGALSYFCADELEFFDVVSNIRNGDGDGSITIGSEEGEGDETIESSLVAEKENEDNEEATSIKSVEDKFPQPSKDNLLRESRVVNLGSTPANCDAGTNESKIPDVGSMVKGALSYLCADEVEFFDIVSNVRNDDILISMTVSCDENIDDETVESSLEGDEESEEQSDDDEEVSSINTANDKAPPLSEHIGFREWWEVKRASTPANFEAGVNEEFKAWSPVRKSPAACGPQSLTRQLSKNFVPIGPLDDLNDAEFSVACTESIDSFASLGDASFGEATFDASFGDIDFNESGDSRSKGTLEAEGSTSFCAPTGAMFFEPDWSSSRQLEP